ncbi:MAG: bacteriochlorophyll/chlorophyll a synthase, partial [Pseudomonadota bacterium]
RPAHALAVAVLVAVQVWAMAVMMRDPKGKAPWYNGPGVGAYVSGMMIAAIALRGMAL